MTPGWCLRGLFLGLSLVAGPLPLCAAAVPGPEALLPEDTLLMASTPDFARWRGVMAANQKVQLWNDPAMRPFREKVVTRLREEFLEPLQRELGTTASAFNDLAQGQLTVAMVRLPKAAPRQTGFVFLLDTKDKSTLLTRTLADVRKKWTDSGRKMRIEKIRDREFAVISLSTNEIPKTLLRFLPRQMEYQELGEEAPKDAGTSELFLGQAESLLIATTAPDVAEKVLLRLGGGAVPSLGEVPGYIASRQALFRDAPLYAWANTRLVLDELIREGAAKKENPQAPNPFAGIRPEKLLTAAGLDQLQSAGFSYSQSAEGEFVRVFLNAPESTRGGLLKLFAGEPKETAPPPFVPADCTKFQRWRIDGAKAWSAVESMLRNFSVESANTLNFILDTANLAAREKDPGFDIRKALLGNLGDDLIIYSKAPKPGPSPDALESPSVVLIGSPVPEQLAGSLKYILVFLSAQAGAPEEREFLGRKIFSIPVPALPFSMPGVAPAAPAPPRTLHYSPAGSYVAFSTDASLLEEYLRSADTQAKALKDLPGLAQAAQNVAGPGTSYWAFENTKALSRTRFELLRTNSAAGTNLTAFKVLGNIPGTRRPEQSVKDWMDFALLPPYDGVSRYFNTRVAAYSSSAEGLLYQSFWPKLPPAAGK